MATAAPVLAFNPVKVLQERPWLERALGALAPSWELRRMQARVQKHLFHYQAAQADRIFAPKTMEPPAESMQTARDRQIMMFEARDLVENFGPAKVILNKYAENIAPSEYAPATGDREYDKVVANYFHDWCKKCDFEGRHTFKKLVEIAVQTRPVDGDCGLIIRRMDGDEVRLQLVAGDRIGSPVQTIAEENYFSGITVDRFGRPVTFRVFRVTRFGQYTDPEEIGRENFLHYADQFRSDQYRGVTDFHAVLRTARMLKEILEAEQVGVNFASKQAALIFNETGAPQSRNLFTPTPSVTLPNNENRQQEYTEYGVLRYLTRGDKVEVMPSRPGTAFEGFTELLMDQFALGIGVSCGVLFGTKDYKGPSVRAEFAQADRTWSRHRGVLGDKVLDPAKDAVLLNALAVGDLKLPKRIGNETTVQAIKRMLRGSWRFPAKNTIDVGRESDAKINENVSGLRSAQEIAGEENADAFDRIEENAQIAAFTRDMADKYEVPETTIRLVGKVLPSTPAAAAAAGELTGDAAAKAQKDASPTPKQATPGDEAKDATPEAELGRKTVLNALARGANRHQKPLETLLARSERLTKIREKLGETTRTTMDAKTILGRIGYVAPPAPVVAPGPKKVTIEEVRAELSSASATDEKLSALVAGLKSRKERLTAAAVRR